MDKSIVRADKGQRPQGSRALAFLIAAVTTAVCGRAIAEPQPPQAPDWRFVAGGRIRYPPAVSTDLTIYVVSDDARLRAVDPGGREIWSVGLGARAVASPVVSADGTVVVLSAEGAVSGWGAQGRLRWRSVPDRAAAGEPAMGRTGEIYVPLVDARLAALDYRGRTLWIHRFAAALTSSPTVSANGQIYVCTEDRLLHALGPDGGERWAARLPSPGGNAAIGTDGTVYVSAFGVHAFGPDGSPHWDFPLSQPTTDPVVARVRAPDERDVVVVGTRDGRLHRIDQTGRRVEEIELGGEIEEPPAIRQDGAMVVTTSRGLYRLRPGLGAGSAVVVPLRATSSRPVLTPGGLCLVGAEDWVLTAASFGDRPIPQDPAVSPWPQSRQGPGNTGSPPPPQPTAAYVALSELAASPEAALKRRVLETVRAHLSGSVYLPLGAGEMESLLGRLALEGSVSPVYVDEQNLTDDPELRAEACGLLGELGTRGARAALLTVVERDRRREVQSSATAALGRVGYDPDGSVGRALARLARRNATDAGLLDVVVRALREVAAATGPGVGLGDSAGAGATEVESRPAWAALVAIVAGPYPESAREAARQALKDLAASRRGRSE